MEQSFRGIILQIVGNRGSISSDSEFIEFLRQSRRGDIPCTGYPFEIYPYATERKFTERLNNFLCAFSKRSSGCPTESQFF